MARKQSYERTQKNLPIIKAALVIGSMMMLGFLYLMSNVMSM